MGERGPMMGAYAPEALGAIPTSVAEVEQRSKLRKSQKRFANRHGVESWDELEPLWRVAFWTRKGDFRNNWLMARTEAVNAGFNLEQQQRSVVVALIARLRVVSRSGDPRDIKEYYGLVKIFNSLIGEQEPITVGQPSSE